jgi:hypothetical protein
MKTVKTRHTPLKAIRRHCVECVGGAADVLECGGDHLLTGGACSFFPYRMGRGRPSVKTIRKFCLDCMGGSQAFVRECENTGCTLHPYRMGRNPNFSKDIARNLLGRAATGGVFKRGTLEGGGRRVEAAHRKDGA